MTPLTIWVKPGKHTVECRKGADVAVRKFRVKKRQRTIVRVDMDRPTAAASPRPAPKNATLTITAKPWATCSIDGKLVGVARIVTKVKNGVHLVACEHKGLRHIQAIIVRNGVPKRVHFDF